VKGRGFLFRNVFILQSTDQVENL